MNTSNKDDSSNMRGGAIALVLIILGGISWILLNSPLGPILLIYAVLAGPLFAIFFSIVGLVKDTPRLLAGITLVISIIWAAIMCWLICAFFSTPWDNFLL